MRHRHDRQLYAVFPLIVHLELPHLIRRVEGVRLVPLEVLPARQREGAPLLVRRRRAKPSARFSIHPHLRSLTGGCSKPSRKELIVDALRLAVVLDREGPRLGSVWIRRLSLVDYGRRWGRISLLFRWLWEDEREPKEPREDNRFRMPFEEPPSEDEKEPPRKTQLL